MTEDQAERMLQLLKTIIQRLFLINLSIAIVWGILLARMATGH